MAWWSHDGMNTWWHDHMMYTWCTHDGMIAWWHDHMMAWSHDGMITWWHDHMMAWSHDVHMMAWSHDGMITWCTHDGMFTWCTHDGMITWWHDHMITWWFHQSMVSCDQHCWLRVCLVTLSCITQSHRRHYASPQIWQRVSRGTIIEHFMNYWPFFCEMKNANDNQSYIHICQLRSAS